MVMMVMWRKRVIRHMMVSMAILLVLWGRASAQYPGWQHSGSLYILTTPEGANLPASASEDGFPLLVRLHKDFFDFSQAKAQGEDIRFSTSAGGPPRRSDLVIVTLWRGVHAELRGAVSEVVARPVAQAALHGLEYTGPRSTTTLRCS
jgi:hypothetical protein